MALWRSKTLTPVTSAGSRSGRELHAVERQVERPGERLREHGLPDPGDVLDQDVALREQAEQGQPQRLPGGMHGGAEVRDDPIGERGGRLIRTQGGAEPGTLAHDASGSRRSTSSRIAWAIASFDALVTTRSPAREMSTTSLSELSNPTSPLPTSL